MTNTTYTFRVSSDITLTVHTWAVSDSETRARVEGGGFHLARASRASEADAIDAALAAAGWSYIIPGGMDRHGKIRAARVAAVIEARRACAPIAEG